MNSPVTILNANVGHTLESNSKALLTEPLRPFVMDKKKTEQGPIDFLQLLQQAGFDRHEKINTGNPITEERRGRVGGKITKKPCKYQY